MLVAGTLLMSVVATAQAQGVVIHGNVYGGGNLADVQVNTEVNICAKDNGSGTYVAVSAGAGVTIEGNVYGGGKGQALLTPGEAGEAFLCAKAMVGIVDTGVDSNNTPLDGGTTVRIFNGTVGTLEGAVGSQTLKEGTGNVYGGGQVGRVERNTIVTIGAEGNNNSAPHILGNVFGAGAGVKTHGYSALVRGNSSVTVQGGATVGKSVYGGGQVATVGRYSLVGGLPSSTTSGGECTVTVRDKAEITENVFGAGKGTLPYEDCASGESPLHMNGTKNGNTWEDVLVDTYPAYDPNDYDQNKPAYADYLKFIKSLALSSDTYVTISGEAKVKGSVFGGSESGFVQQHTQVKIQGTCVIGTAATNANIFGGGLGSATFSEAGIVRGNTEVYVNGGTTNGTVYGGGRLGNVIGTTEVNVYVNKVNNAYEVVAKGSEPGIITGNVYGGGKGLEDTFTCEKAMVGVDGDGIANPDGGTTVRVFNGTVNGNVYGGGEVGRVEKNTVVTIGFGEGGTNTSAPYIKGNVFGAGAGKNTHGFSALVRGNSTVTVQGDAKIGKSVYGGGEIATVGRYVVVNSRPTKPAGGGLCTVTVKGHAIIGQDSEGDVFGAGKGVLPSVTGSPWSMLSNGTHQEYIIGSEDYFAFIQTLALTGDTEVTIDENASVKGSVYGGSENGFVLRHTQVTVQGSCEIGTTSGATDVDGDIFGGGRGADTVTGYDEAGKVKGNTLLNIKSGTIHGSVYGGGEKGYTIGSANVNMLGGTVNNNVFGGGALANTNTGNGTEYVEVTGLTAGTSSVAGLFENTYVQTTDQTAVANKTYYNQNKEVVTGLVVGESSVSGLYEWSETEYIVTSDATAVANKRYYTKTHPTTVNLLGGTIGGDAYGGGLGRLAATGVTAVEAKVYGDVNVNLNGMAVSEYTSPFSSYVSALDVDGNNNSDYYMVPNTAGTKGCIVNRVFGCNDLNGSPQSNVTVSVYGTQNKATSKAKIGDKFVKDDVDFTQGENEANADYIARVKPILADKIVVAQAVSIDVTSYLSTYNDANATVDDVKTALTNITNAISTAAETETNATTINNLRYDVKAVYGGGNEAAYIPATPYHPTTAPTGSKTHVIIHGCDYTSIETVYGGGNAAPAPETNVDIYSTYEIENVFGGGNGKDAKESDGSANPGANVGDDTNNYGTGNATTWIYGGTVHEAYGGSNEKGTIYGSVTIDVSESNPDNCTLDVTKIVGAGKNADVNGDLILIMGCKPETKIPLVYGGADNANVNGNVELTITSGRYGKVFGGNNMGGIIMGHIKLNIEETGDCETPIEIDELYLGGNQAMYSQYGYYKDGDTYKGRTAEMAAITDPTATGYQAALTDADYGTTIRNTTLPYAEPELNVISCTYIGQVFGGGYGERAAMYADPTVNINMIQGSHASDIHTFMANDSRLTTLQLPNTDNLNNLGIIGDVFGGGNAADVIGNPTVNIGTASSVTLTSTGDTKTVLGAYITGNVYGGGKGEAKMTVEEGNHGEAFLCEKAMVTGDIGTHVKIGNGFVRGNVYGGGEVGRVEHNTEVTIGLASGTSTPVIKGNVFGAGKGTNTHGYSALVRGHSRVTVQADSKVLGSVYGGGEMASVGKYSVGSDGLPVALAPDNEHPNSGYCYVTIKGNAEIGPNDMVMNNTTTHKPDDHGHVFGAGMGVLPYEGYASNETPKHMDGTKQNDGSWVDNLRTYPVYNAASELDSDYEKFIKSLALATQTVVTIEGNPFIKGSVYGGSENGYVQKDTKVTISGGQIGNGYVQMDNNGIYLDKLSPAVTPMAVNRRYTDAEWTAGHLIPDNTKESELYTLVNEKYYTSSLPECASWQYGAPYAPYDKDADANGDYPDGSAAETAEGGRPVGSDGHTFYGNVFGGGSGYYPYKPGRWFEPAGAVYGNTEVEITGGHILTNVYGGNEMTDVGKYTLDSDGKPTTTITSGGKCTITMSGGTIGVPRTLGQIDAHPVTCYLFGAGKGDQRVFFNKSTNVGDVEVNITGGTIYGSAFGGGEDGHVLRNVTMTIGEQTTTGEGDQAVTTTSGPTIGTWGTSYVDGNVFGGGRGFGGDAYTAGNVAGSITMDIKGGTMLGSIYGGGRLGSVGYGLYTVEETEGYGKLRADDKMDDGTDGSSYFTNGRGHIDITISGGTIGNDHEYIVPNATNMAAAGIPEADRDISKWNDTNKYWDTWRTYHNIPKTEFDTSTGRLSHTKGGNVFAGGMGRREKLDGVTPIPYDANDPTTINWHKLGNVKSTSVTISGSAWIKSNVYGGGELGAVRSYYTGSLSNPTPTEGGNTEVNINGGTIGTMIGPNIAVGGTTDTGNTSGDGRYTFGSVYGGGYGTEKDILDDPSTSTVGDAIPYNQNMEYFAALIVGNAKVEMTDGTVLGSVFGGGEVACIGGSTTIEVSGGTVGVNELRDDGYVLFGGATMGNVFGGGRGSENAVNAGLVRSNTTVNISGTPEIYHNVYGGGALGSVGWFTFTNVTDAKPIACSDNTGTATVTITGGTIGINGHNNGMVYGASRGGEGNPNATGSLLNQLAWVKNTVVTIGTAATNTTAASGPTIKGSVYGGGENGHNFRNSNVTIHGGTIGTNATATYDNGNVYGAGCGTDTYTEDGVTKYNPMAGCVWGNTSITIDDGLVLHNVYGGGAMGSVGTYTVSSDMRTFTWQDTDGNTNTEANADNKNTGICNVTISGGEIGNVFGGGKGKEESFWCEKAIAYSTNVHISNGTVNGNVYGGGEVGRVETDTEVKIGLAPGEGGGTSKPTIGGSVFGGGAGVETHGYSALVRGNTTVIIDEDAHVTHSVYGGGEIASVGKYGLDAQNKPSILQGGGYCNVTVQGNATIGDDVFGAGKGVTPHFDKDNADHSKRSRRMTIYNSTDFPDGTGTWEYCENYPNNHQGTKFVWDYFQTESDYSTYLETLALATHPELTIDGNAAVSGSVFGGGELGLTKGSVIVNIQGGTITEDVYGGGSLADTNTTSSVDTNGDGTADTTIDPTTTVNLKGGTVTRNVYGGGLGQLAKDAVTGVKWTQEEIDAAQEGGAAYGKTTNDWKVEPQDAVTAVAAKVYGNVLVKLNEPTTSGNNTTYGNCYVKGTIFGCNNLNGSPQGGVTVHVWKTVQKNSSGAVIDKPTKDTNNYEMTAVYGGGNLAAYYPDDVDSRASAKTNVIIDGCDLTSIGSVYGGGNAASVPATEVVVNGTYEIGEVFGGGNGKDNVSYDGVTYVANPGANVGYLAYTDDSDKASKAYGEGKAHATIYGGVVHVVYGGSNTKGNVRVESRTTLEDADNGCDFNVGEAYGGGHNAPQDGDAVLEIGCISGMDKAYGGAANADVNGDVILNITNGTYGQVFGGNDAGGAIRGTITVNIEETGCRPIIIGELYGGGNQAAYSVYGYDASGNVLTTGSNPVADPVLNVHSFTSIGTIYGGGFGANATMVGNPVVNIDVYEGKYAETYNASDNVVGDNHKVYGYPVPSHAKGAIGAINNVFGGGYGAAVIGNPTVNIGTHTGEEVYEVTTVAAGVSVTGYYTLTAANGTATANTTYYQKDGDVCKPVTVASGASVTGYYTVTAASGTATDNTIYCQKKTIRGADIRGNVFGGGNNADVTGDTNVVIGRRQE